MELIPSVDISNGVCVKLVRGRPGTGILVGRDPVLIAKRWEEMGARRLHVVDLDGAKHGALRNLDVIMDILRVTSCHVGVGGGIRTVRDAIKILKLGARWAVVGTRAIIDPLFLQHLIDAVGSDRILLSLDISKGKLMIRGWEEEVASDPMDLIDRANESRVAGVIVTSIDKEGTLSGANLDLVSRVLERADVPVYYAGGVSSMEDLDMLSDLGVSGVIVGMALYTGAIDFKEALRRYDKSG